MKEHPTKVCPKHGEKLIITTSGTQLVCRRPMDECDYFERVEVNVDVPKTVARAINKLRKRTRRRMAKNAECTCGMQRGRKMKNGHGHAPSCARYEYEQWRWWKQRK